MKVTSERCEIEGMLIGIQLVLQYISEDNLDISNSSVYIFSDCSKCH